MVDKDWTFVLGAQDPEMREIKKAISHAGSRHVHAAKAGVRCNPRTAYEADGVILTGPENSGRAAVLTRPISRKAPRMREADSLSRMVSGRRAQGDAERRGPRAHRALHAGPPASGPRSVRQSVPRLRGRVHHVVGKLVVLLAEALEL